MIDFQELSADYDYNLKMEYKMQDQKKEVLDTLFQAIDANKDLFIKSFIYAWREDNEDAIKLADSLNLNRMDLFAAADLEDYFKEMYLAERERIYYDALELAAYDNAYNF